MTPLQLTMKGFGSFMHEQTFRFPTKPGLYFMTGRNEAELALERNGSGKSTVWDALTWCLFGKDARGLSAGNVANWNSPKGASVSFAFEVLDERNADAWMADAWMGYTIERTYAPNSWKLHNAFGDVIDLARDTTNEVYALLCLTFDTWLSTVLMAQDAPMFLDLKPIDKAALFSNVMRLDRWDGYSKTAMRKCADQSAVTAQLQERAASIEGELRGRDAVDMDRTVLIWEEGRIKDLAAIEHEYWDWINQHIRAVETESGQEDEANVCRVELKAHDEKLDELAAGNNLLATVNREKENHWSVCEAQLRTATKLLNALEDNGVCEACDAPATPVAIEKAKYRMTQARRLLDVATKDSNEAHAAWKSSQDREADAHDRATKALNQLRDAEARLRNSKSATARIDARLDGLEEQADLLTKKDNPHAGDQKAHTRDRQRLGSEHTEVLQRLDLESDRGARLGIWVRAFKDIRLELIGEALGQLEAECAGELSKLGLDGWELVFEVDRETASGTVARGFNVFVKGPANTKQVPWEAWSGGEAQRLRVAAQGGLANLIRSSTGASIALEVWDEPSHGMSARGVSDLLQALRERAQVEQRVIFVVDHHALASGSFDGTVTVVKTRDGSHIEQE